MAGQNTVQRVPLGALDLLGMKGTGTVSSELLAAIQAGVDLTEFFMFDRMSAKTFQTGVINAQGINMTAGLIVPQGEIWLLTACSATAAALGAGESYTVRMVLARKALVAGTTYEIQETAQVYAPTTMPGFGWNMSFPRMMRAEDGIGIQVDAVTAGTKQFTLAASYYRLEI